MDQDLLAFIVLAVVASVALVTVLDSGASGAAIQVLEAREYKSFSERLCPNPERPVPVIVQSADLPGTTGKSRVVNCVSADTTIQGYGRTFYPEWNRKQLRFAYGREDYHQL